MSEVRTASGRRIDWQHPPKPNQICSLVLGGQKYIGSLRTLAHLNHMDAIARAKYGQGVVVIQPDWHRGVAASAGTHDYDACWDLHIPGVGWWEQQRFFRANGFACWYRHPPLFGNHIHGFTLPPHKGQPGFSDDFRAAGMKVGKFIDGGLSLNGLLSMSSQIDDYYNHAFGLAGRHEHGSDHSWFPAHITDTIFNLWHYIQKRQA